MSKDKQEPQASASASSQKRAPLQRTTVLILGGGMAGVQAAHTLKAAGMNDFILIEGADKLGGRASSANWVHGVELKKNPLMPLAIAAKMDLVKTHFYDNYSCTARDSNGKNVTEEFKKALKTAEKSEFDTYEKGEELGIESNKCVEKSLLECSLKDAMSRLVGYRPRAPVDFAAEFMQIDFLEAKPPAEVSFLGNWNCDQEEVYGIQDHFLPDSWGLTKVVQHLAKEIFAENDPRLRLNETVTEVHFALDNDRSIPDDIPKEGVLVKTASGNKYYGRFCIITFTNAVMLSGKVNFQPELPAWKVRALKLCETAVYNKIFIKFADDVKPFWDPTEWIIYVDSEPVTAQAGAQAGGGQHAGHPLEFKLEIKSSESAAASGAVSASGTVVMDRPATSPKQEHLEQYEKARRVSPAFQSALKRGEPFTRGYYEIFQNLSFKVDCEIPANKSMVVANNMLMLVVVDEMAKWIEQKSEAELKTEVMNVLRRMYGDDLPEPKKVHCTKWFSNPLMLGSYHVIRPGTSRTDLDNLSRGIRNLHFAGDGATDEYNGFCHGSYLTGEEKAHKILKKLGKEKEKKGQK